MYTPEETAKLGRLYALTSDIESIAKELGKTPRSVIAKLVREGLYRTPKAPTPETKKHLLKELSDLTGIDLYGLEPASKQTLKSLLQFLEKKMPRAT